MKKYLFVTLLCLLLVACQKGADHELLVINTHAGKSSPTNLSEVFTKVKIVNLETKDSPLIGRIDGIDITKDFILVNEVSGMERNLQEFSQSGGYIRQIGRVGHGPGECSSFSGTAIDTNRQRIIISSRCGYLLYDLSGNFIQSFPRKNDEVDEFMAFVDGQLWKIVYRPMMESDQGGFMEKKLLYKLNDELIITDSILTRKVYLKREHISSVGSSRQLSIIRSGNYIYCPVATSEPVLRDTMYKVVGLTLIPVIKLDFSEILSVGEDTYANADFREYIEKYRDKIRNVTLKTIYRTEQYLFAEYYYQNKTFLFCYDLESNKGYNMLDGFTDDLFGTGKPVQLIPLDLRKGEFCFVRNGYELEGILDGVDENSNPVVFFMRTKE